MKDLSVAKLTSLKACKEGIDFVKAFGLTDYNLDDLDITGDWHNFVGWVTTNKDKDVVTPVILKNCFTFNGKVVDPNDLEALKASNDTWYAKEYNEQGLLVKFSDSYDYWYTKEYNDQGLEVKFSDSNDYWSTRVYNDQGLEVKFTNSNDRWHTREYNDQGLLVKFTNSNDRWYTHEYNDQDIIVKYTDGNGFNYDTRKLPEGILCQVLKGTEVVLSVTLK